MNDEAPKKESNWFVAMIAKVGPGVVSALVIASIAWIGSSSMQTNTTLALMSKDIVALQKQLEETKSDLKAAGSDKYTYKEAIADRSLWSSEISHMKEVDLSLRAQVVEMQGRILDLERAKK